LATQPSTILIARALTRGNTGLAAQGERQERADELIKVAKPARNGTVRVTFELPAAEPEGGVSVVGDFNGWDPYAHPLRKRGNGARTAVINVPAGSTLHFRYLAEGGSGSTTRPRAPAMPRGHA
jgi:1,4-alpha-glucan branching enzyme